MADLQFNWVRHGERIDGVEPLLCVKRLYARVGIRRIIEDLSLDVYSGDAVYITGPNGSGKSTLLNAIAGLEPACVESGSIIFRSHNITNWPPHKRARLGLGYIRQRENVFANLTVGENLFLALGPFAGERFRSAHPDWAPDLPLNRRVGLLSGGQRQRLAWAMATLRSSKLTLADEPEAGISQHLNLPDCGTFIVASHVIG